MRQVQIDPIQKRIYFIRERKVMLDSDLAALYKVPTRNLKRAVKRNVSRFPLDFMFELTLEEYNALRCQIGTLEKGRHAKYLPYVFTREGVAMLSSVLKSERAAQVNVAIMRAFVRLSEFLANHKQLYRKLKELEKKYDTQFKVVFDAIRALIDSRPADGRPPKLPPVPKVRGFTAKTKGSNQL
jgi:hypothetical protein